MDNSVSMLSIGSRTKMRSVTYFFFQIEAQTVTLLLFYMYQSPTLVDLFENM